MKYCYPANGFSAKLFSRVRQFCCRSKLILVFVFSIAMHKGMVAQTSLTAGDIAIVGYNSEGPTDNFSFVLLTNISSGTTINFTDFGWCSDGTGFQKASPTGCTGGSGSYGAKSDGAITWTSSTALPTGTEVVINCQNNLSANKGTVTGLQATVNVPTDYMSLAVGGDQIFAFQGTLASPSLITGMNMNGDWDAAVLKCDFSSTVSSLPAALNSTNSFALSPEVDNAKYNCAVTNATAANLRAAIFTTSNWTVDDAAQVSLPLECTLSTSTCTAPSVTANPVNRSVCANGTTTFGVMASGTGLTYKWQVNAGAGFTPISDGGIYSNATTKILTVTGAASAQNGYQYRCVITGTCGTVNSNSVTLTVSSVTPGSATQTNVSCNGGSNGVASIVASGGVSPYSYSWSPSGGTAATASGLAAGYYTVTVTDNLGCTASQNFTITQPAAIAATSSVTAVSCNGGSNGTAKVTVTSGGAAPYTYQWSAAAGGQTTQTATGLAAGSYSCLITDANSCTKNITGIIVTQPSAFSVSTAQANVSCNGGSNGVAAVVVSGGAGSYTYSWSPSGGTRATATGLAAGTYTVTITDANSCQTTRNFTITQPEALTAYLTSQTNLSCNGGSNGTATVKVTGGTGSYTYSWSPSGGTAATATGLAAGNYTVTVTDDNGCTATQSTTITQPAALTVSSSQTNVSCNGGSNGTATVSVTGGGAGAYTYSWSPSGGTRATASGLAAGDYTVTIEDENACQTKRNFTIIQPTALTTSVTSQTNIACNGGSTGAATIKATGGAGPYTYSWSPSGGTAATATGLAAGTYTVTVTDFNSCTKTQNVTITQPSAITTSVTSQTNIACNGGSTGAATIMATGGAGGYTYSWWPSGGTAATATGLVAGGYTVTVTDANACSKTQNVTITQPSAISLSVTSQTNIACNGGSTGAATIKATGGAGSYTYSWSPSGGTAATATGLTAGTYTVTVTDANSCSKTQNVTITEPTGITTSVTAQTNVACNGGSTGAATIMATGGAGSYTYSWSPSGGTAATATGLAAGLYTVTVTDANSCTKTQKVTITQPSAMATSVTSQTNIACNGGSTGAATIKATGGAGSYTYSWSPSGGTAATATGLIAGSYTVTVTDANSCTKTQNVTITQPTAITASITSQTNIACNGGSNGAATVKATGGAGAYTYSWSPSGSTAATATGLSAGTYTVTVTDANACTATQSVTITQPAAFSITPSQTNVSCNGGANGSATVNVTGGTGAYTYSWSPSGGTRATASGLAAGNYMVTVEDANACQTIQNFTITQPAVLTAAANPVSQTICSGEQTDIALSSSPAGAGFSWTVSSISGNVSGASAASGSSIQQTLTGSGKVKYIVTPDNGTCTGSPVSVAVTVNPLTVIEMHPSDKSVYDEESARFSIEALYAASYQWQVDEGRGFANISNDDHYSGTATATLTVSNIEGNMNGYRYRCVASGNCTPVASNSALLSVKVRTVQTISFNAADEKVYGSPDFAPQAGSSAGLEITFTSSDETVAAIVEGKVHIKKAGQTTITASQAGNGDYKPAAPVQQTLTIAKRQVTVSLMAAPLITKAYDGNTEAALAGENYVLNNTVKGDELSVKGTAFYETRHAGIDKEITVSSFTLSGSDKENYSLSTVSATVKGNISPKPIEVSVMSTAIVSKTYDGTDKAILQSKHYNIRGVVGEDQVSIGESVAVYADKKAGYDKAITVNGFVLAGTDKDNYSLTTESTTTSGDIIAKEITVSLASTPVISKTYDGNAAATIPAEKYQLKEVEPGDDVTVTATAEYNDRNAGEDKTVTAGSFKLQGADKGNYMLTTRSATATGSIQKAVVKAMLQSVPAVTKVYDGNTQATLQAANYFADGIIGEDEVLLSNPATGTYDTEHGGTDKKVTVTGIELTGSGAANYQLLSTTASGNIGEITKKEITIAAQAQTKQYGHNDPALGYTASGMLEGDALEGALTREEGKNAGTYNISIGTLSGGSDYAIVDFTPAMLTITPAPLTIKADDKTKKQGTANPVFTFSYDGLVEGDQPSDLLTAAKATTIADNGSPMGYYDIEVLAATSENYTIAFEKGKLTVTPSSNEKYSLKVWSSSPDVLQVRIYSDVPQKAAIVLYTETGQQVILQQKQLNAGINNYSVYVGNIASSTYILGVAAEKFKQAEKVKVK